MNRGRGLSPGSGRGSRERPENGARGNGGRRFIGAEPNSAVVASNQRAWEDRVNNSPHRLSGENPGGFPARQPGSSHCPAWAGPSNDDRRGSSIWRVVTQQSQAGPSNYIGDEAGSSEGNPGGRTAHYNDGGDARSSKVSILVPEPAGGQADVLLNFIQTRLREYYSPGRRNDASYQGKIQTDLSPYLEHSQGVDSLLPAKPEQTPNTEGYIHQKSTINFRGNQSQAGSKVYANYFTVTLEAGNTFHLYKISWIDIEYVERDVKEENWNSVVEAHFNNVNPPPFFDGNFLVISKISLMPTESMEFRVDGNDHNRVRISRKTILNMQNLHNYIVADRDQRNVALPQDIIKFANNIMKGYCREMKYIESERYFFLSDDHEDTATQTQNLVPWNEYSVYLQRRQGYFQSVRVLEHGLLMNVDFTSVAFWRPFHRLREIWREALVREHLPAEEKRWFQPPNFEFDRDSNSHFFRQQVRVANGYLKNLKIESTHRKGIELILDHNPDQRRRFTIHRVEGKNARSQRLVLNRKVGNVRKDGKLSLLELMCHRDGYKLQQNELDEFYPALKVSKTKDFYIPWGCCYTGNESRVAGKLDGRFLQRLKRNVPERHENIKNFRRPIIPTGIAIPTRQEQYTQISVAEELLEVKPMTLRSYVKYPHHQGNDQFMKPANVEEWAYLSFNNADYYDQVERTYLERLKKRGRTLGMTWTDDAVGMDRLQNHPNMLPTEKRTSVKATVRRFIERHCRGRKLHLIVCFMARKLTPEYATLKFLFDREYGIPSQVIVIKQKEVPSDLKIFTLLLKINVKCRGQNFGLWHPVALQEQDVGLKGHTILMGADVFHPRTEDETYSIAALTATTDNEKINYACRLKALDRNTEIMREILTGMVKELLKVYRVNVGSYPKNIIVFRDGLSDSQYLDCLRVEGTAILQAVKEIQSERETEADFRPNVAIILAIKRHHTRFFVLHRETIENLREGTVVSNTVTNLKDYDFFLASQKPPIQGTMRPTHYLVLLDQISMLPGDGKGGLYNYVFNLCQTFQRCNHGVALVTPVSYAHLAAARAKLYMQDYKLEYADQGFPQRDDARLSFDAHEDLKNYLWFL